MDKRGLEMVVTMVIIIILSISALAILVFFFNSQSEKLERTVRSKITESNVDDFISGCNSLFLRKASFAYCCEEKKVVFGGEKESRTLTCGAAAEEEWASKRIEKLSCENIRCR